MEDLTYLGSCIDPENKSREREAQVTEICGIKRNIFGYEYDKSKNEYTVLLVGASKCGKSTLIDFIANFFMGITSPKSEVLFYVTRDNTDKTDNTDKEAFCFYTFCTNDTLFNFIDSPSITNESGFIDAERKDIFQKFIKEIKKNNIKIHALGIVIQNHFVRLTPAEENMMRFVTGLLGENIENMIPFITYADANTPPVLEALQTFGIDTEKHLAFNNVSLNTTMKQITKLIEIYWEDGLENIQKGIHTIMNLKPIELIDISLEKIPTDNKMKPATANSVAPPTDNKLNPATANTVAPPTDNKMKPVADNTVAPPTDNKMKPATANTMAPPTDNKMKPATANTVVPPTDNKMKPATANTVAPPTDNKMKSATANTMAPPTDNKMEYYKEEIGANSNCNAAENKIERIIRETYDIYTKRDCKICGTNHYLEFKNTRGVNKTQLLGIRPKINRCTTCEHKIEQHSFVYIDCKEVVKETIERIKTEHGLRNDVETKRIVKEWVSKEKKERYKQYGKLILEHLWWDDFSGICKNA